MRPFGYYTLYAAESLRKFRYRSGHGVHSPLAFDLISNVASSPIPFYAFGEIANKLPDDTPKRDLRVGQFLFRLLAHAPEEEVIYLTDNLSARMPEWGKASTPNSSHIILSEGEKVRSSATPFLVYAATPSLAQDYLKGHKDPLCKCDAMPHRPMLLIDGIRRSKKEYQVWRECLQSCLFRCIVLDFYHCVLVVGGHRAQTQLFRGYLSLTF
ncbi:MAG: hypothetical protein Q3998_05260 [Porphyromonas sp.]|nr:hypothetical protein [Porphyromonas sp.]